MKQKLTFEEKVAQLTEEQQDKIIKIGVIFMIIEVALLIPWLCIAVIRFLDMINASYRNFDEAFKDYMIWCAIGFVVFAVLLGIVYLICPQYSDRRWWYIHKMRKANKNKNK